MRCITYNRTVKCITSDENVCSRVVMLVHERVNGSKYECIPTQWECVVTPALRNRTRRGYYTDMKWTKSGNWGTSIGPQYSIMCLCECSLHVHLYSPVLRNCVGLQSVQRLAHSMVYWQRTQDYDERMNVLIHKHCSVTRTFLFHPIAALKSH